MKEITYSTLSTRNERVSDISTPVLIHSDGRLMLLLSYDELNGLARVQHLDETLSVELVSTASDALLDVVIDANIIQVF